MTQLFEQVECMQLLPVPLTHALIAIVCNLKLWLNFRSVVQLFVPLRAKVMRYMCSLSDKELRLPGIRTMAGMYLVVNLFESEISSNVDNLFGFYRFYVECCQRPYGFSYHIRC